MKKTLTRCFIISLVTVLIMCSLSSAFADRTVVCKGGTQTHYSPVTLFNSETGETMNTKWMDVQGSFYYTLHYDKSADGKYWIPNYSSNPEARSTSCTRYAGKNTVRTVKGNFGYSKSGTKLTSTLSYITIQGNYYCNITTDKDWNAIQRGGEREYRASFKNFSGTQDKQKVK